MNHQAIVCKLIGPISPVGKTEIDGERIVNLETMINLVHSLIVDIVALEHYKNSHEYSVQLIGKKAAHFVEVTKDLLGCNDHIPSTTEETSDTF